MVLRMLVNYIFNKQNVDVIPVAQNGDRPRLYSQTFRANFQDLKVQAGNARIAIYSSGNISQIVNVYTGVW